MSFKYNKNILNKKLVTIVKIFEKSLSIKERIAHLINVISNYKNLQYFAHTK